MTADAKGEGMELLPLTNGSPCMPWPGVIGSGGYGRLRHNGKWNPAHRFVYHNIVGPIPPGMVLDHLCRNRACVNPHHMEPVTNMENILRGVSFSAVNAKKTHCKHGHPFTGYNLCIKTCNGRQHRYCRACQNQSSLKGRRKAEAKAYVASSSPSYS